MKRSILNEENDELEVSKKSKIRSGNTDSIQVSSKIQYFNKQRVLIIASRGITARYRHFLEDLKKIIPHHKKDNKLDTKGKWL